MIEMLKCPYCGTELEVTHAFLNSVSAALHRAEIKKDEKEEAK